MEVAAALRVLASVRSSKKTGVVYCRLCFGSGFRDGKGYLVNTWVAYLVNPPLILIISLIFAIRFS